jgi:CDP-diacylglycerol--glycerol-3-phosphate 3-phosphatidyltransferase
MIPNLLSSFRMIAFLPVIILFSSEYYLSSFFLFTIAAWSDFLDGFLARKYNLSSELGTLLDLMADKILVSSLLIYLVFYTSDLYLLILSLIIILREISITSLRLFLVSNGLDLSRISPDKYGKLKTFFQMFSISLLLIFPIVNLFLYKIALVFLMISAILSIVSFWNYFKFWSSLKLKKIE